MGGEGPSRGALCNLLQKLTINTAPCQPKWIFYWVNEPGRWATDGVGHWGLSIMLAALEIQSRANLLLCPLWLCLSATELIGGES